jgi:hypothetical protein
MTTTTENEPMADLAEKLDRLIDVLSRPTIPADKVLWDAEAAGAYLGVSARQVSERYALMVGFPDTIRLPSQSGRGQLRWKAVEIMAWADRQRPKNAPRTRKSH